MTNREFAKTKEFEELCWMANVKPTARQASKFRRQTGALYRRSEVMKSGVEFSYIHVPNHAKIDTDRL